MLFLSSIINQLRKRPELALLLLVGYYLRVQGINPGYLAHGDELMYGEAVYMILNKTLGMEPQVLGYYPPLIAWLMLALFLIIFIPSTALLQQTFILKNIFGKNWSNALYWGRFITVIFSCGAIALTYFLFLRVFKSRLVAFLSSLFVTINYRLILNSKIGFLDIYNVFFLLLAILAIINLFQNPNTKNYILTSIAICLSFLVKYQIYAVVLFGIVHFFISLKIADNNSRKFLRYFLNRGVVIGGGLAIFTVTISHYYHFQHWEKVRGMYEYQALKYGMGVNILNIFPISYLYHTMLGPLLSITAIIGIFIGLAQKKYRVYTLFLLVILTIILFIYCYYSTGGTYTRNLLVALPILFGFSALALSRLVKYNKTGFLFLVPLVFLSLNDQFKNAQAANEILSNDSGKAFIEKSLSLVPKNSMLGVHQGTYSVNESEYEVKVFSGIDEVLSFRELLSENVDFAISDISGNIGSFVWWMGQPTDIAIKFWSRPFDLLSQGYVALATRELLWNHTLAANMPRWQVHGYNYALLKLQKLPQNINYTKQIEFSFKEGLDEWTKLIFSSESKKLLNREESGKQDPGSLSISKEEVASTKIRRVLTRPGMVRWESPTFNVKGNHSYKIEAWIKADQDIEKISRNGFIRLDFYEKFKNQELTLRPKISFVSERYWGNKLWKKLEIEAIAPPNTKYARIGFQTDYAQSTFYVDNISIFESTSALDIINSKHIIIDDEDLFPPNDGGFL